MDLPLMDLITQEMPAFNRDIVDGLAVKELRFAESYIDRAWKAVQPDFPKGLKYEGYSRMSHREEYEYIAKRGGGSATIEVSPSDTYMVSYHLTWMGEKLNPVNLSLPIVSDGGIFSYQGSKYSINPVVADRAISVGLASLFVPIWRDLIKFNRILWHVRVNGDLKTETVILSALHRENKRQSGKRVNRLVSSLPHYLFARFGVTETFKLFAGTPIEVGNDRSMNEETHPSSDWVRVSSTKQRPVKFRKGQYVGSDVVIAIPKATCTDMAIRLAAGFFYVADFYPYRVTKEDFDETYLWMVLMGITIWGTGISEGELAQKTELHLQSLDTHLDIESRRELLDAGVDVANIYDLLAYLTDKGPKMMAEAYNELPSMYGKRLYILRYLLKDVVAQITTFMYAVKANRDKILTAKDINERLRSKFQPNLIFKYTSKHGEIDTSISSPGDNKYFKITSKVVKQVNSSRRKNRSISITDPANFLHVSIAECGSFLTPSASDSIGHERINPCVRTSETNCVIRNDDLRELLDDVQKRIERV